MNVSQGVSVSLTYKLYISEDENEELVEEATIDEPMDFVYGVDPMLPEFEKALEGLKEGDKFDFGITMENAYGPYLEERVAEYPKSDFLVDGEIAEDALEEGMMVPMRDDEGNEYEGYVIENKLNTVVLDFNHPLAGGDLYFKGRVVKLEWPSHLQN